MIKVAEQTKKTKTLSNESMLVCVCPARQSGGEGGFIDPDSATLASTLPPHHPHHQPQVYKEQEQLLS